MKISIEEREVAARGYFTRGYNCCQSVLLAFKDILELPEEKAAALGSGFGGGFGRLREVCGAVSGMTFLAGAMSPAANPDRREERTANYALVQKLAGRFKEMNGSIICRELLGLRAQEKQSPEPQERTAAYYHTRPCEAMVGTAARIIAEELAAAGNCPAEKE